MGRDRNSVCGGVERVAYSCQVTSPRTRPDRASPMPLWGGCSGGVALTAVGAIAFGMLPLVLGALYDDGVSPESALLYRYLGSLPPLLLVVLLVW